MTPARKVTLAQLRAAAPKGWEIRDWRLTYAADRPWRVGAWACSADTSRGEVGIWHHNRQAARRMCLAALRELRKDAK